MFKKWEDKPWFPTAAALCIAVVLFVLLTHLGDVFHGILVFLGFFTPVFIGIVFSYFINPLSRFFNRTLLKKIKTEKKRHTLSNALAFLVFLIIIVLALVVILPQLLDSIVLFASNLDNYLKAAEDWAEHLGIHERFGIDIDNISNYAKNLVETITKYVSNNLSGIINGVASVGKGVFQYFIGFILSIYFLGEKHNLLASGRWVMKSLIKNPVRYSNVMDFLSRCNGILNRYVVFNLIGSLIISCLHALLMLLFGMPYVGLVTFALLLANMVPTFGPIVGAIIGAFVLFLVDPWYALAFLGITIVLQILDAYIIRPRLYGNSLGVSALWVLVGVLVGGRMLGILGILVAIPAVAIIDLVIQDYIQPWLEKRGNREEADTEKEPPADPTEQAPPQS
ncbi:MAG: AI-2E family transporter [Lachnospiraceae bacterium]|nr:AI-2E family transporter [Lachnospiraceae bacterium]